MQITASRLCKRFGRMTALDDVSFSLPAGAKVALIGPNGSGKSTLLRVLMGILECEGEVLLDGRAPRRERVELARRMAYVPQAAPHLGAPVAEVVRAVASLRDLDPAAVADLAARLDLDLAAVAAKPMRALSGGMRQKVLIALALASRADLLMLDEPTASLDAVSRERFFALLSETGALSRSLVLCSHRLEEMRHLADHVLHLEAGKVAFDGPAASFLDQAARTTIEVRLRAGADAAGLLADGFRPGLQGWYARTLPQGEKLATIDRLRRELGADMTNLVVRDLERLDIPDVSIKGAAA